MNAPFFNQTAGPTQDPKKETKEPTQVPVPEPIHSPKTLKFLSVAALALSIISMSAPSLASADALNRQLQVGSSGSDVSALQTFLAADPTLYPQGLVTGYFGFLSKAAVSNFQSRNGLPPVGRVGPATLPVLNLQMANGTSYGVDLSAPSITSVSIDRNRTTASFHWNTSDMARGKLFYSTSPITMSNTYEATGIDSVEPTIHGNVGSYDGVARMSQTVDLSNLDANTTYYYLIEALDASNNISITVPSSFHTTN